MESSGTTIGKGISIHGEVSGEEDFFFDGDLEGSITLKGKRLTLGPNANVHADIVAGDLVVLGRVEGTAQIECRAELKQSAVFIGDLSAVRLSIDDAAVISGRIDLARGPETRSAEIPKVPVALEHEVMMEESEAVYDEAVSA